MRFYSDVIRNRSCFFLRNISDKMMMIVIIIRYWSKIKDIGVIRTSVILYERMVPLHFIISFQVFIQQPMIITLNG